MTVRLAADGGLVRFKEWQETSRQSCPGSYNNTAMLRARTTLRDGDTVGRLRRGLSSTQDPRPVDAMARAACFSRRQFHRLMVQVLGETPGTHQRRLRLDRGAWLLLTSRATVLDVALETGFENHETFTRAFRTRFGITPPAFRKNRGKTLPRSIRVGLPIALNAGREHRGHGYDQKNS
jgi:AraC-like DNA-binding protein